MRLFSYRNLSQILHKVCYTVSVTQYIFTDHSKHKTVNKLTCRTPSANPRQLCAH